MQDLNKQKVLLSNGVELIKDNKFNPFSFNDDLAKQMINACLDEHFKLEREFLNQKIKLKPLSLFFIDDINSYRGENARLKEYFEKALKSKLEEELKLSTGFYKEYLQKSLNDISLTHGGYFSKDNSDKDDKIEQEINEILHDKMSLLSLNNTRRFIFSKWTLKEGWDNPNVFNICKLRSSGSEISKLQEVGRGLRLPVDEYGNRITNKEHYLNYFVDASESDFTQKLINEIEISDECFDIKIDDLLDEKIYKIILSEYDLDEDLIYDELLECGAINKRSKIINVDILKAKYPKAFSKNNIKKGKIKNSNELENKVKIKTNLYPQIKALWEEINKKVFLKYDAIENVFLANFKEFLKEFKAKDNSSYIKITQLSVNNNQLKSQKDILNNKINIKTLNYGEFLLGLSTKLGLNLNTLHKAFYELMKDGLFNINDYLNEPSLNAICKEFNFYLLSNSNRLFSISYEEFSHHIHPTKITNEKGEILNEINASDIGVLGGDELANNTFLYEQIFYDSKIEQEIIKEDIKNIQVFMKIPKNSLKIPVVGGFSYSPDFAYVLKDDKENIHYFVLESKGVDSKINLRSDENAKITNAESLFKGINITFEKQFNNDKLEEIINKVIKKI